MVNFSFNLQRFAGPGDGGSPPSGDPGGDSSIGGGGSSSSSSVTYNAATSVTSAGTYSSQIYTSSTANQNAVLISLSSGNVILTDPTVTKSGDSDGGDNCNFYGINSAVMAAGGATVSIDGGTVTATAKGANGVFSYGGNGGQNGTAGDGTIVIISDMTINTTGDNGGGIMTTGGGITKASNLTIKTTGNSSAPIRTDRGGGSVTVSGGYYESSGVGSPAIYSTADIEVENATLISNHSEGVCIEGQNSVALDNCTLTVCNDSINGNATFSDAVILYQSQSGDAADGTSTFSMTGGKLVNSKGHLFHVTNTAGVINLESVTIEDNGDGVLLSVCDDGWSGASNLATLNASGMEIMGDILVGNDSTLTLNFADSTKFSGNLSGTIVNAKGSTVSSSLGTVNVSLDSDSKWYLQSDTYISSFSGTAANVITGNYTLYVNDVALDGTSASDDSGDDSKLITLTAGADTYNNSVEGATIQGFAGDDSLNNSVASVYIDAGAGADTVRNQVGGTNSTILGGDGADSVSNYASAVTISGDAGNDRIANWSSAYDSSISAGAGNDSVYNAGNRVTINAGAGNDTIRSQSYAALIEYASGDGDDLIYNFKATDTLSISGGTYSTETSGDDVLVTVGDGTISIIGAASLSTVNIDGTEDTTSSANDTLINGTSGADSINNSLSGVTIDAGLGDDTIVNSGDSVSIFASNGTDVIENSGSLVTIKGGAGNDYIYNTGNNVTVSGNDGNNKITNSGSNFVYVHSGDAGNDSIVGFDSTSTFSISSSKKYDIYTSGNDLIIEFDDSGDMITIDGGANFSVNIVGGRNSSATTASSTGVYIVSNTNDTVFAGTAYSDSLVSSGSNVTVSLGAGDDSIVNSDGANDLFVYASGDGNDVINGFNSTSTLKIASGTYTSATSGDDVIVTVGTNTITLSGAASLSSINIDGSAGGSDDTVASVTLTDSDDAKVTLVASVESADASSRTSAIVIVGNNLDNTISSGSGDDAITAGNGADSISGGAGNDKLWGGAGADTLHGGTGNDTLNGGKGNDIFVYTAGFDTITDYASGDKISLGGAVTAAYANGSDAIIRTADGTLTVKNGKGASLAVIDASGSELSTVISDALSVTITDSDGTKVTMDASVGVADASARTSAIVIVGNNLDNTISGGSGDDAITAGNGADSISGGAGNDKLWGGAGADTLWGGTGNDTLIGGKGADTFVYTVGNDVVTDFEDDDLLQITGTWSASYSSSTGVVFTVGSGSLTLKDTSATTFNVNGENYQINGSTLEKK